STATALGSRAWTALSGYVRGTATIALIDALGIGLALLVLGVPLVIPLTMLVFLGGFLPVIGATVAGLVAVLVALADGGPLTALLVLAAVIAVQQLEGHILQPVIMRRAVSLHPIVILVALATGSAMLGIVGAFLSVPAAAVISAVGNELRLRSERNLLSDDTRTDAPPEPLGGPGKAEVPLAEVCADGANEPTDDAADEPG
ncbi:MAG: AI-2E family transporter, partial [Candidatus Microthrix sp.]